MQKWFNVGISTGRGLEPKSSKSHWPKKKKMLFCGLPIYFTLATRYKSFKICFFFIFHSIFFTITHYPYPVNCNCSFEFFRYGIIVIWGFENDTVYAMYIQVNNNHRYDDFFFLNCRCYTNKIRYSFIPIILDSTIDTR